MRKLILALLALIIIAAGIFFLFFNDDKKDSPGKELEALSLGDDNSTFNNSFTPLLSSYYDL